MKCKYRYVRIVDHSDLVVFAVGPYCALNSEPTFPLWYDKLCSTLKSSENYFNFISDDDDDDDDDDDGSFVAEEVFFC